MLEEHLEVLQRVARESGLRSAPELILKQCEPLFAAAGVSTGA